MKLLDFLNQTQLKINGTGGVNWTCYGNRAKFMNFTNNNVSVIFDIQTNHIYEITYDDEVASKIQGNKSHALYWVDPDYIEVSTQARISSGIDDLIIYHIIDDPQEIINAIRINEND